MADPPPFKDPNFVVPEPHSVLSYTYTGAQLRPSQDPGVNDKKPTPGPPMFISNSLPGTLRADISWKRTFSISYDASMALVHGSKLEETEGSVSLNGIHKDGSFTIGDFNTWKPLPNGVQQVQYIASKDTIDEASKATNAYGNLSEVRGIGQRVPQVGGGFGRTIDGLPTDPNPADPRKNDDEHKVARETWKFGPIEMRWDYRKGVWSAFNDLIEDHYDTTLGTWVFGTNNDFAGGYPFLRGKLEDVFWVRKPVSLLGADGTKEGVKTGELMIHLKAKLFDEDEKGAASLDSVFIVPHQDGTDDEWHEKGEEATLGNEITGDGESVDIRTTAHFWKEAGIDGPIYFYKKASELDICCKPSNNKFFAGKMVFMDEPQDVCSGGVFIGGGTAINVSTDETTERGKWVPAVQIDECELVGQHFLSLVNNDIAIATNLANTCSNITSFTSSFATSAAVNFAVTAAAINCLHDEIVGLAAYTDAGIASLSASIAQVDFRLTTRIEKLIKMLVQQINVALGACDCPVGVLVPQLPGGIVAPSPPSTYVVDPCPILLSPLPSLDCVSACSSMTLSAPCCDPDSVFIPSCGGGAPTTPTTEFGNCQTHEN